MKTSRDRWPDLTVVNLIVMLQAYRQAAHWWVCPDCAPIHLPPDIRDQSPGYQEHVRANWLNTSRQAAVEAYLRWRDRQYKPTERIRPWPLTPNPNEQDT